MINYIGFLVLLFAKTRTLFAERSVVVDVLKSSAPWKVGVAAFVVLTLCPQENTKLAFPSADCRFSLAWISSFNFTPIINHSTKIILSTYQLFVVSNAPEHKTGLKSFWRQTVQWPFCLGNHLRLSQIPRHREEKLRCTGKTADCTFARLPPGHYQARSKNTRSLWARDFLPVFALGANL